MNLVETVSNFEKQLIQSMLQAYNGNVTKTAEFLEVNRTTLIAKIERMKITIDICRGYDEKKHETRAVHKITGINVLKRNAIIAALEQCNYNRTKTAEALGFSYRTVCAFVAESKQAGIHIPDRIKGKK